jgi:hypothetical protein
MKVSCSFVQAPPRKMYCCLWESSCKSCLKIFREFLSVRFISWQRSVTCSGCPSVSLFSWEIYLLGHCSASCRRIFCERILWFGRSRIEGLKPFIKEWLFLKEGFEESKSGPCVWCQAVSLFLQVKIVAFFNCLWSEWVFFKTVKYANPCRYWSSC